MRRCFGLDANGVPATKETGTSCEFYFNLDDRQVPFRCLSIPFLLLLLFDYFHFLLEPFVPILKLTQLFIANGLQCPGDKTRIEYCDSDLPGLYVEVRATSQGQGTYYLRYKDANGKTCHQKLGRTTELDLMEARKKAKTQKAEIALGADPRKAEKARKEVLTFSDFFELHYLPYVTPRKRSWKRDDELYKLRIKGVFGDKRLNQITRQQIQSFHTDLLAKGLAPATCDHHVKLIKHALNLAIDWGLLMEKNPAARIIAEKPTHQVIANQLGSSREMISRIFKNLRFGGYIKVEGRKLTINKALPARL